MKEKERESAKGKDGLFQRQNFQTFRTGRRRNVIGMKVWVILLPEDENITQTSVTNEQTGFQIQQDTMGLKQIFQL